MPKNRYFKLFYSIDLKIQTKFEIYKYNKIKNKGLSSVKLQQTIPLQI